MSSGYKYLDFFLFFLFSHLIFQGVDKESVIQPGPTPPDFLNQLITLIPPVMYDSPTWDHNFGDCILQPPASVKIGGIVTVKFVSIRNLRSSRGQDFSNFWHAQVSGHPRNNLRLEDTFLTVELLDGDWIVIATDADWETRYEL